MCDMMQFIPMVVEQSSCGERSFDIYASCDRRHMITELVNEEMAISPAMPAKVTGKYMPRP